jgi:hypothetical protein
MLIGIPHISLLNLMGSGGFVHVSDGTPFTFNHISWSMLTPLIDRQVKDMAPDKQAAVRAGVLDSYDSNSKGPKILPARGTKRKNVDKAEDEAVSAAQESIDKHVRYQAAFDGEIKGNWETPQTVKNKLKTLIKSGDMTEEDVCASLEVTTTDYQNFLSTRKRRELLESKTYHNGRTFFIEREQQGVHLNKKQRTDSAGGSSPASKGKTTHAALTDKDGNDDAGPSAIQLEGQ